MPAPLAAALSLASSIASALPTATKSLGNERIKQVGQEFEAMFLSNMMEEMFAGVQDGDPFEGPGSGAWRSMQTEQFARAIAAAGGIGLADHVQRQLIALQEKSS
jgi:Rod binding domain-containing protein